MKYTAVIDTAAGRLGVIETAGQLTGLDFVSGRLRLKKPQTALSSEVARQLGCYFKSADFKFDIPLQPHGTAFQQQVWSCLCEIAPGMTRSYGAIAEEIVSGARAVGNACRQNPIPIIIPCHRVVAANHLGGYAGHTSGSIHDRKRWLLTHEGLEIT